MASGSLELPLSGARLFSRRPILKSGCQADDARLRTVDRLTNLLAILCVVGWRVFWLTMVNRANPDAPPETVFPCSPSRPPTKSGCRCPGPIHRQMRSGRKEPYDSRIENADLRRAASPAKGVSSVFS
jgi:hypothetical protein